MLRVLIIGAGDVARRLMPLLAGRCKVYAVVRDAAKAPWWREHGAVPILADLDRPESAARLGGLLRSASWVVHLAPPPGDDPQSPIDRRTRRLLAVRGRRPPAVRGRRSVARRWVYLSTTGVYGDLGGRLVDETAPCHPSTARGRRRLDAEKRLRTAPVHASVLRVPGIYAADRLPLQRIREGSPLIDAGEDVYTNHIHADDLAAIAAAALRRGKPARIYHAVDGSTLLMGDYFDLVADAFSLPRPPRQSRAAALARLTPAMASFLNDSRRLSNRRLKNELGVRLRHPTVAEGLRAARGESITPESACSLPNPCI